MRGNVEKLSWRRVMRRARVPSCGCSRSELADHVGKAPNSEDSKRRKINLESMLPHPEAHAGGNRNRASEQVHSETAHLPAGGGGRGRYKDVDGDVPISLLMGRKRQRGPRSSIAHDTKLLSSRNRHTQGTSLNCGCTRSR